MLSVQGRDLGQEGPHLECTEDTSQEEPLEEPRSAAHEGPVLSRLVMMLSPTSQGRPFHPAPVVPVTLEELPSLVVGSSKEVQPRSTGVALPTPDPHLDRRPGLRYHQDNA